MLEGTSDITVTGNVFSGLTEQAVTLAGEPCQRISFTGNVLTDVETDLLELNRQTQNTNVLPASE